VEHRPFPRPRVRTNPDAAGSRHWFAVLTGPLELAPAAIESSRRQLNRALAKEHELAPVSATILGGVIDPPKLPFPFTHMAAADARDWQAIDTWADQLTELLSAPAKLREATDKAAWPARL
jgi:hypothetical protein